MKLILLLTITITITILLSSCASRPNMQLDCEKKADGSPSVYQCKSYPWYAGQNCSRVQ